jgi:hypothetical protein
MECARCKAEIEDGEERERLGEILCEDCYIDALSPARSCDPWAVHSAKSFERAGGETTITDSQAKILQILKETGGIEPEDLFAQLKDQMTQSELRRDFATLRHMEKVRAEKRGDKVMWRLW